MSDHNLQDLIGDLSEYAALAGDAGQAEAGVQMLEEAIARSPLGQVPEQFQELKESMASLKDMVNELQTGLATSIQHPKVISDNNPHYLREVEVLSRQQELDVNGLL